jgi:putative ABC transport system substrate-binding protein
MKRREFIALLGGAATWPRAARGQQPPAIRTIGFLHPASLDSQESFLAAMRQGLGDTGYTEGRNLAIEYRWGDHREDRLPALAADLVRHQAAVIVTGATPAALAAKAATQTIPIVFILGSDPVKIGLVASLNHPGGNVTGITNLANVLVGKRLSLLSELVPKAVTLGMLINPSNPNAESDVAEAQSAAATLGRRLFIVRAGSEDDLQTAFDALAVERVDALFVDVDPFFTRQRDQLVALAARHAIPTSYPARDSAAAGGLMSYGMSFWEPARQVGVYAARILNGAKPAELPVMQSTRSELVINLKTAKALGLAVPLMLRARADEVIE